MNFKSISNEKLLSELKTKVENERKLLMEILYALREVEARRLHLEMGYPDLYTFAMKELGYTSGAAYRRISAMRLLKSVPQIALQLESGELGLENASQAQSFFRKEDQRRKEVGEQRLSLDEKREVVTELLGKSTREGQRVLMERSPEVMMPVEKVRPLPEQKTLVQFVAPAELMEKLEELKHLLAHKNFEGRMDVLIDQLADLALNKLRPKSAPHSKPEQGLKSEPEKHLKSVRSCSAGSERITRVTQVKNEEIASGPSPAPGVKEPVPGREQRSRYIPSSERRKVLLRDQTGCTFRDPTSGRVCGNRHGLQFEHIVPFSQEGSHQAENLTLYCSAHNRYQAERLGFTRSG